MTRLRSLRLEGNRLSGRLPEEIGSLADLRRLQVGGNRLSGPVPHQLGRLRHLVTLDLGDNDFCGALPRGLEDLAGLRVLRSSGNPGICATTPIALQDTLLACG